MKGKPTDKEIFDKSFDRIFGKKSIPFKDVRKLFNDRELIIKLHPYA